MTEDEQIAAIRQRWRSPEWPYIPTEPSLEVAKLQIDGAKGLLRDMHFDLQTLLQAYDRLKTEQGKVVMDFTISILHGDRQHQAWLYSAARHFMANLPIPPPPPTETESEGA